jgi:hypothetical protein
MRVAQSSIKRELCVMKCTKCHGLMILQVFFDHFLNYEGWKCLNCGKVIVKKEKSVEFDSFSIFYQQNKTKKA